MVASEVNEVEQLERRRLREYNSEGRGKRDKGVTDARGEGEASKSGG